MIHTIRAVAPIRRNAVAYSIHRKSSKKTPSFYEKIEHIFDSLRKKMGLIISVKAYYKTHSVKVNFVLNFVVKDFYFGFYFGAICFCFVAFFLLNGI